MMNIAIPLYIVSAIIITIYTIMAIKMWRVQKKIGESADRLRQSLKEIEP